MAKKKVTLAEFNAWLEGVEEMHDANWSPDAAQWKVIRAKIKTITEPKAQPAQQASSVAGPGPVPPVPAPRREVTVPPTSSLGFVPAPEVPGSVPPGPISKPTGAAADLLAGDGTGKHKTPSSQTGDASPFS